MGLQDRDYVKRKENTKKPKFNRNLYTTNANVEKKLNKLKYFQQDKNNNQWKLTAISIAILACFFIVAKFALFLKNN